MVVLYFAHYEAVPNDARRTLTGCGRGLDHTMFSVLWGG